MSRVQTAGGQAVERVVAALDDLVDVLEFQHRQHRAEDLVLGDRHVVVDVGEQRRLDEVAAVAEALAAADGTWPLRFLPRSM